MDRHLADRGGLPRRTCQSYFLFGLIIAIFYAD